MLIELTEDQMDQVSGGGALAWQSAGMAVVAGGLLALAVVAAAPMVVPLVAAGTIAGAVAGGLAALDASPDGSTSAAYSTFKTDQN